MFFELTIHINYTFFNNEKQLPNNMYNLFMVHMIPKLWSMAGKSNLFIFVLKFLLALNN